MPIHCCNCNCVERNCSRSNDDSSIERRLRHAKLVRDIHNDDIYNKSASDTRLVKLKHATSEIKHLIYKVETNLALIEDDKSISKLKNSNNQVNSYFSVCELEKNKTAIVQYLDKNCKDCNNMYYCCDEKHDSIKIKPKSEEEEIIDLIRDKYNYKKKNDIECDNCYHDKMIRLRRALSRSRSRGRKSSVRRNKSIERYQDIYSDSDESDNYCYYNTSSSSYVNEFKSKEPWRSDPYKSDYPWKNLKIKQSNLA